MQFDVNIRLYEYWHEQVKIRKKRWNNKEINKFVNRKLEKGGGPLWFKWHKLKEKTKQKTHSSFKKIYFLNQLWGKPTHRHSDHCIVNSMSYI